MSEAKITKQTWYKGRFSGSLGGATYKTVEGSGKSALFCGVNQALKVLQLPKQQNVFLWLYRSAHSRARGLHSQRRTKVNTWTAQVFPKPLSSLLLWPVGYRWLEFTQLFTPQVRLHKAMRVTWGSRSTSGLLLPSWIQIRSFTNICACNTSKGFGRKWWMVYWRPWGGLGGVLKFSFFHVHMAES